MGCSDPSTALLIDLDQLNAVADLVGMLVLENAWLLTQGRRSAQRTLGDTAGGRACSVSVCCFTPAGSPERLYRSVSLE